MTTDNRKDTINRYIRMLEKALAALKDIRDNDTPIRTACRKHGVRHQNLLVLLNRELEESPETGDKKNAESITGTLLLPEERLWCDAMGIKKPSWEDLEKIPPDIRETLTRLLPDVLDASSLSIIRDRYTGGLSMKQAGKHLDISRQYAHELLSQSLKILGNQVNRPALMRGLAYQEKLEKARKENLEKTPEPEINTENLEILGLSVKAMNRLRFGEIRSMTELGDSSIDTLMGIPRCGRKLAEEICRKYLETTGKCIAGYQPDTLPKKQYRTRKEGGHGA